MRTVVRMLAEGLTKDFLFTALFRTGDLYILARVSKMGLEKLTLTRVGTTNSAIWAFDNEFIGHLFDDKL